MILIGQKTEELEGQIKSENCQVNHSATFLRQLYMQECFTARYKVSEMGDKKQFDSFLIHF